CWSDGASTTPCGASRLVNVRRHWLQSGSSPCKDWRWRRKGSIRPCRCSVSSAPELRVFDNRREARFADASDILVRESVLWGACFTSRTKGELLSCSHCVRAVCDRAQTAGARVRILW